MATNRKGRRAVEGQGIRRSGSGRAGQGSRTHEERKCAGSRWGSRRRGRHFVEAAPSKSFTIEATFLSLFIVSVPLSFFLAPSAAFFFVAFRRQVKVVQRDAEDGDRPNSLGALKRAPEKRRRRRSTGNRWEKEHGAGSWCSPHRSPLGLIFKPHYKKHKCTWTNKPFAYACCILFSVCHVIGCEWIEQ